jgi:acetyl-CoA carboxylase/biotin carboxylase 1
MGLTVVLAVSATLAGERRWVVTDIVGAEDGLGVENLSGSAAIGTLYCK